MKAAGRFTILVFFLSILISTKVLCQGYHWEWAKTISGNTKTTVNAIAADREGTTTIMVNRFVLTGRVTYMFRVFLTGPGSWGVKRSNQRAG